MTKLAIDNLTAPDRTLEEILESPTIVPKRIGFCSNLRGGRIGCPEPCAEPIMDNDTEAMEMPGKKWCCAKCVNSLLTVSKSLPEPEPEKPKKRQRYWPTAEGRSGARPPKGPK